MLPDAGPSEEADPLALSTGGMWSRASVIALVGGRSVRMKDQLAVGVPIPGWLDEGTRLGPPTEWDDNILNVYPADRTSVSRAFLSAADRPGEVVHCRFRGRVSDGPRLFDDIFLALTGHDGLEVILAQQDLGPITGLGDWAKLKSTAEIISAPVTMEYLDRAGMKIWVDGQVEEIYGRRAQDMVGHGTLEYIDEEYHEAAVNVFASVIAEPGRMRSIRMEIVRPDETRVWIEFMVINRLTDERIGAVINLTRDITEQLAVEQAERVHNDDLRRSHEEFETLANQVPVAVFRANGDGSITFANQQWRRLAGDGVSNCLGDIVAPEDRRALDEMLGLLTSADGPGEASLEVRSRDSCRVFSLNCQAVGGSDGDSPRRLIGSMADVTSTTELRHLAQHDDLTGLLNRLGIERCLNDAIADDPADVVVAFLDLDGFKSVNDNFGHDAGDQVLRAVAERLRQALRPTDDVARFGGDEFVIVCRRASAKAEHAVAARIEDVLVAPIEFDGGRWEPKASIGLARAYAGENLGSVLRRADQAMYAVKRAHHHA